ncbi:Kelch repeat-containing protein [Aurantibacillus circumpalustris]|uniref:Kelch repeat-containing protein n=1 Tax=Aurantibacillus circumpalustris TaxID=3036359 RepID=UPI00295BD458|nr:kelch repeat-containing protein [Aurantibacillus circumpalustris]
MKLLFTFLFLNFSVSAQLWIQLPDFPALKRDDGVAVVVNNKAYFGTGLIEWAATIDFHVLDLTNYSWSTMSTMPGTTERQYACAFAGNNCFYVFGGDGVGGALNSMYKYDTATNTWIAVASKPGNGLIGAVCMNFGDKVIISGGKFQNGKASAEVWEYTISNDSWVQKNNYPFSGRWRASATVHNNSGYLIFGRDSSGFYRKELYRYTPATDNWSKITNFALPEGRVYSSLNVASGKLFVFGGQDSLNHFYKDIWYFNESDSSWLQGPDIPGVGRRGGMSCALGTNFFYSCGLGEGDKRLTETWVTDIPVGIKENYLSNNFSIFPNPVNSMLTIETPEQHFENLNCNYEDLFGRTLGNLRPINSSDFDLSELNPGVYIFKFYSENKLIAVKKILKN